MTQLLRAFRQAASPFLFLICCLLPGLALAKTSEAGDSVRVADVSTTASKSRFGLPGDPRAAWKIANGHAYDKHVVSEGQFQGRIHSRADFEKHIDRVFQKPTASRPLTNGRIAYWDHKTGTVIIYNPSAKDRGTAFQPSNGRKYFENLR